MKLKVINITLDCEDVRRLSSFWSALLDRPLDGYISDGYASIGGGDADRTEPAWYFNQVPEPKRAKNRVHLDFASRELRVDDLVQLGATVVAEHQLGEGGHRWTVLRDPEGNEFCVSTKAYVG